MKKKILAFILTVVMVLALVPTAVFAEDTETTGDVAQIGDTTYATLDEAVTAAADGDTITVLADCETAGLNLSKDLTIKGAENVNPTITFNTYGIALWGKALTFEDCTVKMNNITSTPYTGEWNWMAICASTNASLTLNNVDMSIVADSTSTNNAHCIYFCSNNKLNLNSSTLYISNYKQDALEWDGGDGGYNINIVNSTFISDHNRSGFTGTFYATIKNSTVEVINSLGNGSNGSHFIITKSYVNFSNNTSHGLSTGILTVKDSTITANNNGLTGIIFNNKATFENSDITITGTKGTSYWNAGMRAYTSNASCTIDADCTFRITDNYVSGIFLDASASLTIAEGADVVVTGNEAMQKNCSTEKTVARCGGGIVVRSGATATLSSTTQIYNNHASVAGDDIYLESGTSSITFSKVGIGWVLNGTYLDGDTHCTHLIDGWYNDGYTNGESSARWEADAESEDDNYISLYENEDSITVTGILALKAAHGIDPVSVTEKESLPGLDKSIVVDDEEVDKDTVAAGDTVTFRLTSTVPSVLKDYIEYTADEESTTENVIPLGTVPEGTTYILIFHDVMDSSLVFDDDFLTAKTIKKYLNANLIDIETGENTSISSDYYTLRVSSDTGDGCTFEVSIDLLKLYTDGYITEDDFGWMSVVIEYEATLSEDAKAGAYYNTAWVTYPEGESEKDKVEVDTYGIKVFKYDQETHVESEDGTFTATGLDGAVFGLYKDADCTTPYYKDSDNNEIKLTTADGGYIVIDGLDEGTYYLKELEAPNGYVCSDTVLTVEISKDADAETYYASVSFANAKIPETGGAGTVIFTVVGAGIIAVAGVVLVVSRRKHEDEE